MGSPLVENWGSFRLFGMGQEVQLVHEGKYDFQRGIRENGENTQCLLRASRSTFSNVSILEVLTHH